MKRLLLLPTLITLGGCFLFPPPPLKIEGNFRVDADSVQMCYPATIRPKIQQGHPTPEKYQYEWGDGSSSETLANSSSYTYIKPGNYTIKAKALIGGQVVLERTVPVQVRSGPECTYIVVTDPKPSTGVRMQQVASESQRLVAQYGGDLVYTYETLFQGFAARFTPQEAEEVRKDQSVKEFELSKIVSIQQTQTGEVPWGLDRIDQQQKTLDKRYVYPDTGAGVDVYVVDTGIRASHREFEGRVKPGFSALPNSPATEDCNGHGTHVAGTIGGKTFGVAKGVTLYPVRVFDCGGTTSVAAIIAGIEWVARVRSETRPSVMNLSVGIQTRIENLEKDSSRLNSIIIEIAKSKVFTAIAAGNNVSNACVFSPSNLGSHDNILVVGASTKRDSLADISNFGPCVDLFAPGEEILSAGKDSDQDEAVLTGTSMAAPHAAGVAAIYLARNPNATPAQVKQALISGSVKEVLSGTTTTPKTDNRLLNTGFLGQPNVRIVVEPASITLIPGQRQIFTAIVVGSSDARVRWEYDTGGVLGSDSLLAFTAPSDLGVYTLKAISVADPGKTATVRVTVENPPTNITGVQITPNSTSVASGGTLQLSARVQGIGSFDNRVNWRIVSGGGSLSSTDTLNTVLTAPTVASNSQVVVEAISVGDRSRTSQVNLIVNGNPSSIISISISPNNPTLDPSGNVNLTANVVGQGTFNSAVTWAIQSGEGSLSVGSGPSTSYTAPNVGGTAVVRATSVQDPSRTATATITINAPGVSITPKQVDLQVGQNQNFSATVRGLASNTVSWSINPTTGVGFSSGPTSATFASSMSGTYTLTATSTADNTKTDTATIRVLPNATVSLTPNTSQQLKVNTYLDLIAAVNVLGSLNSTVTWSVIPSTNTILINNGNNATFSASVAGSYTITATSNANPGRSTSISVEVQPTIVLTPSNQQTFVGVEQMYTAALTGFLNSGVEWGMDPLNGATIAANGSTARFTASQTGTWTIIARSVEDSSKTATATIQVSDAIAISPSAALINPNSSRTFTATVNPTLSNGVVWSVTPTIGVTLTPIGNQVRFSSTTRGNYTLTATHMTNSSQFSTISIGVWDVQTISAGSYHSLVLKQDGTLWAFGRNNFGQLGDETTSDRARPVEIMSRVSSISAGANHSLILRPDRTFWNFGNDNFGQLGDGRAPSRSIPTQIMSRISITSGGGEHSLALTDTSLWAFGNNIYGQLGSGTPTSRFVSVQLNGVSKLSAGASHSLVLGSNGTLWAFGRNNFGQLGDETTSDRPTPVQVMTGVAGISAGAEHSLVLRSDGTLWAFGRNTYGQLGDRTTTNRPTPVQVMTGVAGISAGTEHSLVLRSDGTLWAFGNNTYGQLGDRTTTNRPTPVQVMTEIVSLASGGFHSLALKSDGTLWSFGRNDYGQLGDETRTNRSTPVQIMTGVMVP